MAENDHRLRCPVCQGHGELRRSEILNLLSDPDFKKRLDIYLAELRSPTEDCEEETAHLVSTEAKSREFGTEYTVGTPATHLAAESKKSSVLAIDSTHAIAARANKPWQVCFVSKV
jgi:hypothetical protein